MMRELKITVEKLTREVPEMLEELQALGYPGPVPEGATDEEHMAHIELNIITNHLAECCYLLERLKQHIPGPQPEKAYECWNCYDQGCRYCMTEAELQY